MPRSPAADLARLLDDLSSPDLLRRETAVARLAIAGASAVTRLVAIAGDASASPATRGAALRALSASSDARVTTAAASALRTHDDGLALDAMDVLSQVAGGDTKSAARAFEQLAALALESEAPVARRLAALTALDGLPEAWLKPLYQALSADPASPIVARVTRRLAGPLPPLADLVEAGWPDDAALVIAVLREEAETASLALLRRAIEASRAREREGQAGAHARWLAVRGQVHQILATRGSRIGLYDLRDTLTASRGPLPVGFLTAAAGVGDISCLEPIAHAFVESDENERWWRDHLADAFRAIVSRGGVTRRHPALKKILGRWPTAALLVATARK